MNNFFHRVYQIVARIPPGKVATYGQIAALLGNPRGARTVGWAMRSAPADLNLPCHRVVNQSGAMAPGYAFGGAEVQRTLLLQEGVTFKPNGRINMDQHRWDVKFK
ncbi:MAG: MGMT family protein [Firmicutes bacterium]|nr:MGMT family protein [Bacillota bacterium]